MPTGRLILIQDQVHLVENADNVPCVAAATPAVNAVCQTDNANAPLRSAEDANSVNLFHPIEYKD